MAATPNERLAHLLSRGQLLTQRWSALPGQPGSPEIYHNGLGRYFVGRPVLNHEERVTIQYAPDPDRVLEQAATTIRRDRFGSYKYDQDQRFPVTRRLAYAAFPDIRPKNQATALTDEWIVPEVERGECSTTQAAALGLPYRHRITNETIAEWTERHAERKNQPPRLNEEERLFLQEQAHLEDRARQRDLPIDYT